MLKCQNVLLYLNKKYHGDWSAVYNAIKLKEKVDENDVLNTEYEAKMKYVTLLDDEYPNGFKCVTNPPFVIHYYGDIELVKFNKVVSVCGEGKLSKDSLKLIKELSKKSVIALGYKTDLEKNLVKLLMSENRKFILVIDDYSVIEKSEDIIEYLKDNGLVISEYGFSGDKADDEREATRLITGLSDFSFIPNSPIDNEYVKAVITGTINAGKDLYCYPSNSSKSLTNELIKEGAFVADSIEDFTGAI